jgi:hypothetical protein
MANGVLRKEALCQVIKQSSFASEDDELEHKDQMKGGWLLLSSLLMRFGPDKSFRPYLKAYLQKNMARKWSAVMQATRIPRYIRWCDESARLHRRWKYTMIEFGEEFFDTHQQYGMSRARLPSAKLFIHQDRPVEQPLLRLNEKLKKVAVDISAALIDMELQLLDGMAGANVLVETFEDVTEGRRLLIDEMWCQIIKQTQFCNTVQAFTRTISVLPLLCSEFKGAYQPNNRKLIRALIGHFHILEQQSARAVPAEAKAHITNLLRLLHRLMHETRAGKRQPALARSSSRID